MIIKHHMVFIHFENQDSTGLGAREGIVLGTCKMAGGGNQDYLALPHYHSCHWMLYQDYLALCCHTFGLVLPHYHSCQVSGSPSGLLTISTVAAHVALTFPFHPSRN